MLDSDKGIQENIMSLTLISINIAENTGGVVEFLICALSKAIYHYFNKTNTIT